MITLKLAAYSADEAELIRDMLRYQQASLSEYCKHYPYCTACPIRHLCGDINRAAVFADNYTPRRP